ncbi:selenide, water dikinase SelD [Salipiger sp. PrR002]|uniref:selenide, water dikinase SelD n=1 Tax=Salipiger sp. PrR002 TaxID=2706489 RepID=UPI0013BBC587|nr:selenide, water dikinase SelD [Salipiger sp. PrR002]NDW00240.1 selenide, water dikinase SelD [Salipiger sp. PrR002]NDW58621.1 selenide, water dikinase SelD [Salipiger sp. PrR004]
MRAPNLPLTRDLVLIGGGHSHALLLRMWGMDPLPGARVTLINPGPTAPYSGMLPGFVAGHYGRDELDIDLVKLARFAGARVVLGAVTGLDRAARQVHVAGRAPIGFDVASVNIGITSAMPDLPGFAEHAFPAKPLGPSATAWEAYRDKEGPAAVAVIGGGVAGAELACAMAFALGQRGRAAQVHLIERGTALTALRPAAASKARAALASQGVTLHEGAEITEVTATGLRLADGTEIIADFITGAAGARAQGWLQQTGLDLHEGFIKVAPSLQSSDPAIFAAGDCAHLTQTPRPKAGVFAVREAPVLLHNLRATLEGRGDLRPYRPQRDYLKLISLGRKSALADKGGLALSGPLMWRWKDHIDRKFMRKFDELPKMTLPVLPRHHADGMEEALGTKPMCGGCGAKVGRDALAAALSTLPAPTRPDVTALPGDDAALLLTGGQRQVMTVDHLRAFIEDPEVMARITCVHALGDIWAMGAAPQAAVASLTLPRMSEPLAERTLTECLRAITGILRAEGAELVGGHSAMGDELSIGLTITGLCDAAPITLAGARPGDTLILTKPIGTGVIMAAEMAGAAKGAWVAAALAHMTKPQGKAAEILRGASAMTDVTGFGLAGHLQNICSASGVGARLHMDKVPLLPGAEELSAAGHASTLYPKNRAALPFQPMGPRPDLMFDPQTAGGLLGAVSGDVTQCLQQLRAAGFPAVEIGEITDLTDQIEMV